MVLESGSSSPSPCPKRSRDPGDEVYLDNFHSHKRYLTQIMASSLNGLRVEDSLDQNLIESPARDDISLQYSPMSEDSDDARYGEPTSPVSPHRHHRSLTNLSSSISFASNHPSHARCVVTAMASSEPRQRNSEEGKLPSSPSDICHSADLRRAALLRSLQMRSQPLAQPSFGLPAQVLGQNMEAEELPFSCAIKSPVEKSDESEFFSSQEVSSLFVEDCSEECGAGQENGCGVVNAKANVKE